MARVVIADLHGKGGFVNKDTVAGGYGSRFWADSVTTRLAKNARRVFHNVPSIHAGYLAGIFSQAGHEVVVTRTDEPVDGDLALVLTSIVDHRHECEWGSAARHRGMKVGFFGTTATHLPELFTETGDFVIKGEPEAAALRLAAGEELEGLTESPQVKPLESLPFPKWDAFNLKRYGYTSRNKAGLTQALPMLTSRSCPEHCTYCPHRITASFSSRAAENVVDEMAHLAEEFDNPHLILRDPLFTLDRDRCFAIADGIRSRGLQLTFECETRMDDLDEELIRAMHAAGLREISFGVESVDPETLKRVGRRFISHDHMREMVALCWKLGIVTTGFYVFGFLQDTDESIRATIEFACDLDTAFANFKLLTPYPGTPLYKQMKHLIFENDWEKFDGYTLNFDHPSISPKRARLLLGMAYSRFIMRPSQLLNLLGLHRYSRLTMLRQADALSWKAFDHFDRSWLNKSETAAA